MHAYQPDRLVQEPKKSGFLASILSEHPALLGGACLSLLAMGTIFANAVWYQPVNHPAPMFATRGEFNEPAKLAKAKKPTKAVKTAKADKSAASPEVLREVQAALAVRGYYDGKVDGKFGSRTESAITKFQADHDLEKDGQASARLLSQILLSASAKPQEVPVPNSRTAAISQQQVGSIDVSDKPKSESTNGLVARIQAGLRNYGYEELEVDGKPGRKTRSAIQSFQLDYGMKITGEPSESVLKKLEEIGAYRQG
ncbi:peptidoglycan-binding protein [Pseudahrensia aquimaris]|uniref:Peptidoglycan-binding protein n=1 Tax=Pseudahrensia aquimaris TaxID=744461 RepID=A0ABW3FHM5_9HYPH